MKMTISENLKDCKLIKLRFKSKIPLTLAKGDDWNKKIIGFGEANQAIQEGYNIGLVAGDGIILIDADQPESVKWCDNNLKPTYIEETCSKGKHYIYKTKDIIENANLGNDMGELRCNRQYVVIAPSQAESKITKTIEKYTSIIDMPLTEITKKEIEEILSHFKVPVNKDVDYKTIIQLDEDKQFLQQNVISKLGAYLKDLVTTIKTKEELQLLGFPSRSERDMKIVSYLLNKGQGEYIFAIFKHFECGDKVKDHNSPQKYMQQTMDQAIKFLGMRSQQDMGLEFDIETISPTWLKRHLDEFLLKINSVEDDSNLFKERLYTTLAFRARIHQKKLSARVLELAELTTPKKIISLFELNNKEYEEQEYWLAPMIPKGSIIMLASKPGEGKSLFIQGLITSLLSTGKFLDYEAKEKPKTILYSLDDSSEKILHSRHNYFINGLSEKPNFNVNDLSLCDTSFTFNKNNLNSELSYASKYDIIIIDAYRRVLIGEENNSSITDSFFNNFLKPLKEAGKTIIMLHHLKKANLNEIEDLDLMDTFRGSSDIVAQLDLAYLLKTVSSISGDPMIEFKDCMIKVCKNRLGISFKDSQNKFTNNICYRVTKNMNERRTNFNSLDSSLFKSVKERRWDSIKNILKNSSEPMSRDDIVIELLKNFSVSKLTANKDLEDMCKSYEIERAKKGFYKLKEVSIEEPGSEPIQESTSGNTQKELNSVKEPKGL